MRGLGLCVWLVGACTWVSRPDERQGPKEDETDTDTDTDTDVDTDTDTDGDGDTGVPVPPSLVALSPGSAGRINVLVVEGALSGAELRLSSGSAAQEPVVGCPALTQDVDSPVAAAGPDGTATMEVLVDVSLLGQSETFQVVQAQNCAVSERLVVDFPQRLGLDLADADARLTGESPGDEAGSSVSGAGDVNNDGFDDFLVGAAGNDAGGYQAGRAYLFLGPVTGNLNLASADAAFTGEEGADYASSVSGAGDVDGDGIDDVLIGATGNDAGGSAAGRAYLFLGPVTGDLDLASANAILTGETSDDHSGFALSAAGDVNDDGRGDFLVGAIGNDAVGDSSGRAYLFLGPVTGNLGLSDADAVFTGEATYDQAGYSVSGAGDLDGDGRDDLLVGAGGNDAGGSNAGRVYVFMGPVTGDRDLGNADILFTGETAGEMAGYSVSGASDVNGDGLDDILIGAWVNSALHDQGGRVYLFWGPLAGTGDAIFTGEADYDQAGISVSGAGDVNDDGFHDLLIGANGSSAGAGRAYLFLGPVAGDLGLASADVFLTGETTADNAGQSVSSAGDVDGDGKDDLLVGAYSAGGNGEGRAYLILGSSL